ncbi:MAG: efflux RND transporter permease subunit [Proteobacteria bacterium]|nr:efflux RND transporter permease subunit [Pseudomonadota bacterium]
MILKPIEDALAEVPEIKDIDATAFDEMAVTRIELNGNIDDFNLVWDDVREALEKAYRIFPEGAGKPVLDDNMQDQDSVVLSISGSSDVLVLSDAAKKVKDGFLNVPEVAEAHLICDPKEQVTIDLDDSTANRMGINANDLALRLSMRNRILPGGSLKVGEKTVRLKPLSEFSSVAEIASTPVLLPSGSSVPLGAITRVHRGPAEPSTSQMRFNGEMSVGVAIVPVSGINLVEFGHMIKEKTESLRETVSPLTISEVTFQPRRTEARIGELSNSLMFGILIVAGILILAMGARLGLLVASVVPLVTMVSLLLFAWGDGVLHQISIAALVLSLGMLVDNAIVMAESIQYRLDKGERAKQATIGAVKELYIPLAAATLTTLAAVRPNFIIISLQYLSVRILPSWSWKQKKRRISNLYSPLSGRM